MQSQALHNLSGLTFPYNVSLAAAAPFVDIAGFPLIYTCSPATSASAAVVTVTNSTSADSPMRRGHCHPTVASSDASSVGGSPDRLTPPDSGRAFAASTGGRSCHLPYPSLPAEGASLAASSPPPYVKARTLLPNCGGNASPGGCRLPRPFTIEAILGLESPRCVDDALDAIVDDDDDDGHLDYDGKLRIRQIGPLIGSRLTTTANVHLRSSYDHHNVSHKRIHTSGKECRRNFGHTNGTVVHPTEKPAKSKRVRTIFTPEQLERLESEFERQQYMVGPERLYLAASLNLTEAQVKVWFQNRRIKWRKQHLELQQARLAKIRGDGDRGTDDYPEDYGEESTDEDVP